MSYRVIESIEAGWADNRSVNRVDRKFAVAMAAILAAFTALNVIVVHGGDGIRRGVADVFCFAPSLTLISELSWPDDYGRLRDGICAAGAPTTEFRQLWRATLYSVGAILTLVWLLALILPSISFARKARWVTAHSRTFLPSVWKLLLSTSRTCLMGIFILYQVQPRFSAGAADEGPIIGFVYDTMMPLLAAAVITGMWTEALVTVTILLMPSGAASTSDDGTSDV